MIPQAPPEPGDEPSDPERGGEPADPVGHTPPPPQDPDPDPGYRPDPGQADEWRGWIREISKEHRPRREDVYPYLLIRARSPGDRGQRPLWPPTVCWESPDILLIDAGWTGPFDPSQLVASPRAGRSYRVFVRIWNLGLLAAEGIHVQAWAVNPGFIGAGNEEDPYYRKNRIGGAWARLDDRTRPGSTALVELDSTWNIEASLSRHECLLASVTCPADHFAGPLLVNGDRHVGQRNLEVLAGGASLLPLLSLLGNLVPERFTVELTHGGPAALPLLQALTGGVLVDDDGRRHRLRGPTISEIRAGVDIGSSVHLLTAFREDGRTVVARSDRLARYAPGDAPSGDRHPFAAAGGARRILEELGPERWKDVGTVGDQRLGEALPDGLALMLDVNELSAATLAERLGGPVGAQHLLRLTLTEPDGAFIGGYSIVLC